MMTRRVTMFSISMAVVLSGSGLAAAPAMPPAPVTTAAPATQVKPGKSAKPAEDDAYEKLKILVDVLDYIQQNHVDEPDVQRLVYGAAEGMVGALDPFSQFLEPELHKELKTETEGEFGGLGLRLGMKDEWLTVVTPMPGSPAYRMGILPNDRIVEIDGETTRDIVLSEALKRLRGRPGTKVKLMIMRGPPEDSKATGPWTTHEFALARETIKIESVQFWKIEGDIGYMRITDFNARTTEDVQAAMKSMTKEGMGSLVLDLRNNPGGLLTSAIDVSSQFLGGNKLVVSTRGRKVEKPQEFRTGPEAPYADIPLVVLVNEGSASGSEIVAGAFQDHHRAVVLGTRTFGKASVQSVIPLADGSGLRLTVARYYTPAGRMIHRDEKNKTGGILPDIVVPISRETESKLYVQWDMIYEKDKKPKSVIKKEHMVRDETLDRAVELLKARESLRSLTPGKSG
ncbi:MAG: S41 family peptidase [Elusimicrobia bacterium]|nr:S41 family peptidase [Elusimicrobiota bacterium]